MISPEKKSRPMARIYSNAVIMACSVGLWRSEYQCWLTMTRLVQIFCAVNDDSTMMMRRAANGIGRSSSAAAAFAAFFSAFFLELFATAEVAGSAALEDVAVARCLRLMAVVSVDGESVRYSKLRNAVRVD
ncbi:hypothetical protein PINS_up012621 [Pythium insidiosum]|nr:hypothetical protein PINS_up012621 [Pythium insidiosum]